MLIVIPLSLFVISLFGTIFHDVLGTNNSGHFSQTRYVVQAVTGQPTAFHQPNHHLTLLIALVQKLETAFFVLFHASLICQTISFTALTIDVNLSTIQS
jgi:hypothetical protein